MRGSPIIHQAINLLPVPDRRRGGQSDYVVRRIDELGCVAVLIRTLASTRTLQFRVSPVMTTSIPLRIYLNTILSPAAEKPAQKKLRIWGEFVGRTTKIFNYIITQKPATYKGFRLEATE